MLSVSVPVWHNEAAVPGFNPSALPLDLLPPTVVSPAAATPSPVTGTTTNLSVLGDDEAGESTLTYAWATTGTPPAAVGFSINGTNDAKNTVATFSASGVYSLQVTITDENNLTAVSSVSVTVNQTATSVVVTPATATVAGGTTTQLTATELDQFGLPMATQPVFTWAVASGLGTVSPTGLFTAATGAGAVSVSATDGSGPSGSAALAVVTPLAWYQMDAASGTTLTDSSGNGQTAALIGSTSFTAGVSGHALDLTGGYANLPDGIVSSVNDFTISAWINVTTLQKWDPIFGFGTGTTNFMGLSADSGSGDNLRFTIVDPADGNEQLNGPAITPGVWTHVAVSLSGETGTLYVNGQAVATNAAMTIDPSDLGTTTQNYLGSSQFAGPDLAGEIDDFRIYDTALSAPQVQQLAVPSIVTAASASADPVTTTSTRLSVLASDVTAGESALTYTWATTGTPPAAVVFGDNGTNTAKNTTATFTKAGTYHFTVTVVNPVAGEPVTSSVDVTVSQALTAIAVSPSGLTVNPYASQQFSAIATDQFGNALSVQPTFTYSLGTGSVGSITTAGLYTASSSNGSATIIATSGLVSGSVSVAVADAAPTVATAASATPSPVTGTTTDLAVLGNDDAGESTLTYTWVTTGTPPAAVGFTVNGTNAAKNTVATFTAAGSYSFLVTITNASGLTVTSSVNVTVVATATTVSVLSAGTNIAAGGTAQLTATALDQFGVIMASQPAFTWSVTSGGGSVSASGLYTSVAAAGTATVTAAITGGPSGIITLYIVTPVAWYQMDASSGTTLADSSGNNLTGAVVGAASFVPGVTGNALNLDGGYATLPTGIVSSLSDYTISAWVNVTSVRDYARIFDFGSSQTDTMTLIANTGTTDALQFDITNNGYDVQSLNGPTISAGVWTHIAITLSGTLATLYVNGVAVDENPSFPDPSILGITTLNYLGKSQISTDPNLLGSIDDFRIYSEALSGEQLQQLATFSIPAGWTDSDIGSPGVAGSAASYSSGLWTVNGGGAGITGTSDQFNFASTSLSGDLVLVAENSSVGSANPPAAAGLMIRSSTDAGSVEASLLQTPSNGVYFQTRTTTGGATQQAVWTTGISGPVWLQLDRIGTNISGYLSNDDINWYQVGTTVSVPLGNQVLAGFAVSSGNNSAIGTSNFTNTSVAESAAPTVVTPATASQSTFTGYSTNLSVLGADDTGEKNLTYTWGTTGTPPAPVTFTTNASNAAKNTQATFTVSGTYNLTVTLTDPDGLSVQSTVVVTVTVPPPPPTGVTATWIASAVDVTWLPVAGAQSYNIYRSTTIGGEGSVAYATNITATTFVDAAVTTGTSYYYEVTAVNAVPLESGRSFEVAAQSSAITTPIISEFMAINNVTLADVAGGYPDWLELYNPTAITVTLTGDYLTDSTKTLNKWQFPSGTIAPDSFLIVFCDSQDDTDSAGVFHTNFNIGGSGGYLALVANNATTVLSAYTYPQQVTDVSYGIGLVQTSTGSGMISSFGGVGFLTPTPNAVNGSVLATGITAEPTFNYPDGFYSATFSLTITSATAGASIYYTLDGTAPSATNGTLYTGPLTISGETTIRAMAVAPEFLPSSAAAASYIYLSQVLSQAANGQAPAGWPVDWGYSLVHYGMDPGVVESSAYSSEITQDLLDLPSVSLTMNLEDLFDPVTGIYSESQLNKGQVRPGSIELINPSGAAGFQADVGVALKGDYSARAPNAKHGFDIKFSNQYGISQLDYPLFGANAAQTFEEIQLRTDQENSWSFVEPQNFLAVRDEFESSLLAATGEPAQHFKICFLYINGMFWGLYDIIEKPNSDYAASYFGGSASDYDVVEATYLGPAAGIFGITSEDGTLTAWNQLYTDLSTLDLSNNANYEMIQGNNPDGTKNPAYPDLLDVNNLVSYMLTIFYTGSLDGPYSSFVGGPNNFYAIRPTDGSFGFRFIATDSEQAILNVNDSSVNLAYNPIPNSIAANPSWMFEILESNPNFRALVADVAQQDFLNNGPMTVAAATTMFDGLVAQVQGPVVGESARWGNQLRPTESYTRDTDWQAVVDYMTGTYFPGRTQVVLNQLEAIGLYPPVISLPTFNQYGGTVPYGFQLTMALSGIGSIYYTLNGSDPENSDGSISSNAIAYTGPISILSNEQVSARAYSSGSWSAVVDATFTVVSNVRITELNYDPPKPPSGSPYNNDDFEFVELENFSNFSANLTGVAFTNGINYTFGNITLGPWQVGVLVHNLAAFQSRYGTGINVLGSYQSTGQSFSNSGETVELVDSAGNVLDHFNYTPCITAYPTTHEGGASLEVLDPYGSESLNLASSWRASLTTNGTPGTVPLLLGNTPVYLMLDPTGQYIDLWNASVDTGTPDAIPVSEIYAISFTAAAAGDSLTLDFTNGNPLKSTAFAFNGGSTGNALTIVGTTTADTFTVNASTGVLTGSFGTETITYSNTSTITFVGQGGADTLIQTAQPGGGAALVFDDTAANQSSSLDTVNVSSGTFSFAAPAAGSGVQSLSLASLSIGANATVSFDTAAAPADRWVLELGALTLPATAQLNLGGNDLIVHNGSYSTILGDVISGYNATGSNTWGGPGIASSAASSDTRHATALAVLLPGTVTVFDNQPVSDSDVVVKFTYYGDANLDGKVDASDYSRIDNGYLNHLTGWYNGDFNYDGVINGSDYTLIDNAFNSQGAVYASSLASPMAVTATAVAAPIAAPIAAQSRTAVRVRPRTFADRPRGPSPAAPVSAEVFQTQTPISPISPGGSVEQIMQDKDVLEKLSADQ